MKFIGMGNVMSIVDHIQHYKTMVLTGWTRVGDVVQASHMNICMTCYMELLSSLPKLSMLHFSHVCYIPCPSNPSSFDHYNNNNNEEYKPWSSHYVIFSILMLLPLSP